MAAPTRKGTFNGEKVGEWTWSDVTGTWLNLGGIANIGSNLNITNPLNFSNIQIDTNAIAEGIQNSTFGQNMQALSEGIQNLDGTYVGVGNQGGQIQLLSPSPSGNTLSSNSNPMGDIVSDVSGNTSLPYPPLAKDYDLSFSYSNNKALPFNSYKISFGSLGVLNSATQKFNTSQFTSPITVRAKNLSYGDAEEIYTIQRENSNGVGGIPTYDVVIKRNGLQVKRISPTDTSYKFNFTFTEQKTEPVLPTGIEVAFDIQTPDGITVNSTLGDVSETNITDGESINNPLQSLVNLNIELDGTDTTCNYLYELFTAAGKLLLSGNQKGFQYDNLPAGRYIAKVVVSKTQIPILPADTPSYTYRRETYYETKEESRGKAAAGPLSVKTTASLINDSSIINIGAGATSEQTIEIKYSSTNADYVIYTIGKNKTQLNSSGILTITEGDLFNGEGNYTVYFQAVSDTDGSGDIVPIKFTAIRKNLLPGPDILTIEYPELIVGKDYQGYNVDFEISWTSINTNYVDIYINEVVDSKKIASKRAADGVQSFNIRDILRKAGDTLDEDVDVAKFYLKLIPYNEEGDEKTAGKTETVQIKFDKGNIKLRRDLVLRDIKESICDLFDTGVLGGDSSKYLTHLMHFGEADNKVIASWDTDYETFSEYEFREDTGERVKIHEEKTLVFKLYEPLPREVQPNQQVWVSKIQSIPYVEQITLVNEEVEDCIELAPNFGTGICSGQNIGYQLYDDLIASGSSSSTKLLTQYVSGSGFDLKKLDIQFVTASVEESGSVLIDGESSWAWNNFVKYSSAEERINNFMYKIKLLDFYQDKITKLQSGSLHTGSVTLQNEISRNSQSIQEVKDNFDAFETFLFTSSSADGLTYPGAGGSSVSSSTSDDTTTWYNTISTSAQNYDYYNKDYLVNNLPLHVQNSEDSEQFKMFFNMMGHHFDVLYAYTKSIAQKKNLEHKYNIGIKDSLLAEMLKSLSWDTKIPAKAQSLWEYAFGETSDGTSVASMTGKQMQNQIWRRILNNLPYLMKYKGTSRAVKAALACYGVPSSMLTIMEFGGPRNADGGTTKFSFEDRTAALNISGSEAVLVPWKEYTETSDYPNCVEIRVNSNVRQDQTFISSSLWSVGVVHYNGNQGKLKLTVSDTTGSYAVTSSEFPFYNDEYTQVIVTKDTNSFKVYGKEAFQGRIRSEVSASLELEGHIWQTDTTLKIGGDNFTGSVDEFRYWTTPLSESRMDNHTLMPDAIDGNHHSSSTEDLIFRLDFEYPKDRSVGPLDGNGVGRHHIKNVSINEGYGESFATASGFTSISEYPYHYTTYERTVTANVPSSGFNVSQKFRFEEQQGLNEDIETGLSLSYRERSTKKSYDTSPIDSNRLGLFFSPIKEINMDILKSIGQFELDSYIGDPADEYRYEYRDLTLLRNYYFERYNLNLYEYIQLVRYIDQSLFEVLESLVPARAIVSSGLLIEPHILERNKVKRTKPQAVDYGSKFQDGKLTLRESLQLAMVPITQWPADLRLKEQVRLAGLQNQFNTIMQFVPPNFSGNLDTILARMRNVSPTLVSTTDLLDGKITDSKLVDKILKQFEAFNSQQQIGISLDSLSNGLAGITADNGYAIITKLDGNGRLIKEKKQVWLVTEQFTIQEWQPIEKDIDPVTGLLVREPVYGWVDVVKTRKYIVFSEVGTNPETGRPYGPTVGGNIIKVERVTSNMGKTESIPNLGDKYGKRGFRSPARQTQATTLDRKSPVETFCTNPNILKVSDTSRGAGEPILEVDVK